MSKKIEISAEDLLYFISAWFKSNKLDLPIDKSINLTSVIIKCFEDKMMFDSWFRGVDVMN